MGSAGLSVSGGSQSHLVAGRSKRVDGVAIATLTALPTGQVPGVGSATVAVLANHVRLAGTLAAVLLALAVVTRATGLGGRAWHVAHALCTESVRSLPFMDLAIRLKRVTYRWKMVLNHCFKGPLNYYLNVHLCLIVNIISAKQKHSDSLRQLCAAALP